MNYSDSNNNAIPDDVLLLSSVVRTFLRTLNAEEDKDMVIPRKSKRDNTQMTTSVRTLATTLSMELMKTKTSTTFVEMAQMMVPLISNHFTMTVEVTTEILVQLSA